MTLPFENDTGPVIKKLAARSIQTDKRRNLFVIVTIALAAALMAAIFCTGAGSDRKLEADLRGQYQAVVVNCDRDTIEKLKDYRKWNAGAFPRITALPAMVTAF